MFEAPFQLAGADKTFFLTGRKLVQDTYQSFPTLSRFACSRFGSIEQFPAGYFASASYGCRKNINAATSILFILLAAHTFPTDPFTIPVPHNSLIDVSGLYKVRFRGSDVVKWSVGFFTQSQCLGIPGCNCVCSANFSLVSGWAMNLLCQMQWMSRSSRCLAVYTTSSLEHVKVQRIHAKLLFIFIQLLLAFSKEHELHTTNHFTIWEHQNPSIDVSFPYKIGDPWILKSSSGKSNFSVVAPICWLNAGMQTFRERLPYLNN